MERLEQGLGNPAYESTTRVTEVAAPESDFLDKTAIAWEEFTVAGAVERVVTDRTFDSKDPDFWNKDTEVKQRQYLNGLSHEGQMYVSESRSPEEALWRRDRALHWDSNQRVIEEAGFVDMIIPAVAASLADPTTYLYGAGGVKVIGSLAKASIAARFGTGATLGLAYELPQYATNIHSESSDLVLGAVVGGLAQTIFPIGNTGKVVTKDEVVRQLADREEAIQQFQRTTSAGAAEVRGSILERENLLTDADEEIISNLAMRNAELDAGVTIKDNSFKRFASKVLGSIDVSITGGIKRSAADGNVVSEFISKDILSDASGESTRGLSAADYQHSLRYTFTEKVTKDYEVPAEQWILQNTNITAIERGTEMGRYADAFAQFDNKVYELMQHRWINYGKNGYSESKFDPQVIKAADILDDNFASVLQARKDAGEAGFVNIEHRKGYVPAIMDNDAVQNAVPNAHVYGKMYGEELLRLANLRDNGKLKELKAKLDDVELDANARLKIRADLETVFAKIISRDVNKYLRAGKHFFDNLVRTGRGFHTSVDDIFSTVDEQALKDLLGDADVGKQLFEEFQEVARQSSKSSRAKQRIHFDLNKTSPDGKLKLSDLYSRNIRAVGSRYGREAAGAVALAKKGIKSQHDWRELARLGSLQEKEGSDAYMKKMDDIYNMFLERPVDNATARWARRINEFTALIMLGRTGIAQLGDLAMTFANNGFINTVKAIAEYTRMSKAIREGTADAHMLSELQALGGRIGDDHILFSPVLDRIGEQTEAGVVSKAWSKYDEITGQLSRDLYYVNGMNHIKRFQQRVATIASVNKLVGDINSGKNLDRLRAVGFDDAMIATVKKEIDKGNIIIGNRGGVEDLGLRNWTNIRDAQNFAMTVRKAVTGQVQDPLLGEGILAMNRTVGALMLKLMAFPLLAMQKQMARSIYHHDITSLALAGYGTMMGAAVYVLNREAGAVGSDKQGEVLEDAWDDLLNDPAKLIIQSSMYNPLVGVLPDFANIAGALGLMPQEYTLNGIMQGREGFNNGPTMESLAETTITTKTVLGALRAGTLPFRFAANDFEAPDRWAYDLQSGTVFGNTMILGPIFNEVKDM